jgi:hypothetical protein
VAHVVNDEDDRGNVENQAEFSDNFPHPVLILAFCVFCVRCLTISRKLMHTSCVQDDLYQLIPGSKQATDYAWAAHSLLHTDG